jgi:hypothetical protein
VVDPTKDLRAVKLFSKLKNLHLFNFLFVELVELNKCKLGKCKILHDMLGFCMFESLGTTYFK